MYAVLVYLALYVVYALVVVFGRIIYQYQKQKTAEIQQRSLNSTVGIAGQFVLTVTVIFGYLPFECSALRVWKNVFFVYRLKTSYFQSLFSIPCVPPKPILQPPRGGGW